MFSASLRNKLLSSLVFIGISAGLTSPAFAVIEVLVNQCGYEPNSPKIFRAQRNADYGGNGTFSVKRVGDNAVVYSGTLTRKGRLWDKWYWEGDFSAFTTQGYYYVNVIVDGENAGSYSFNIANNILRSQTGTLAYKYFWTQRCGVAVPGWHGPCHTDDGIRRDNFTHIDAVGGWHDAGNYDKYAHAFAGDGVTALLWLYENNRSYYDAIDNTPANGIPDIVEEALHQARWLIKMVDTNGHCLKEVNPNRETTWHRPEEDTNNIICSCKDFPSCDACDDRWINPGTEVTSQEIVVCAALIKMHRICVLLGLPTENFSSKALSIWNHRVALAISEGGHNNLGDAAHHIWAGLDLFAVFGQQDCYDRAVQKVEETANININNPAFNDDITYAHTPGYELGVLAWFSRTYPSTPQAATARTAVQTLMSHNINYLVEGNPIGLVRRNDAGNLQYFPTDGGINRLYLLMAWGAIESYRLVGDPAYLRFALDQYNWVMGANYDLVCMFHGAGDKNLKAYHHRYSEIPGHENGAQPGVVPNGYLRNPDRHPRAGLPFIDLRAEKVLVETNEGWLINNAAYAFALSELFILNGTTGQSPYNGSPFVLPTTIQAEHYDLGGQGVAYNDLTNGNAGGQLRSDDVDIEVARDTGGGHNVGWIDAGEWLEYTVNVPTSTNYTFNVRVASCCSGGTFHIELDGSNITGSRRFSSTGGWQNWTTIVVSNVSMSAGNNKVLRVVAETGGWNLNYVQISSGPGQSPYSGSSFVLPTTIQAEHYDLGGKGVAYNDLTSGNAGGQLRSDNVDIEVTTDAGGGHNVGWIDAGEWLEYTVNVPTSANYAFNVRVASCCSGGTFHIELDGSNITGSRRFSSTGGWQNWTTVAVSNISMSAGNNKILRVVAETGGWNLNSIQVSSSSSSSVTIDLGDPDVGNGLTHVICCDGNTVPWPMGGRSCRANNDVADHYFYFNISDSWALQGNKPNLTFTIAYFDKDTGNFSLQYDAASGPYKQGPSINFTNTNTWKTVTWSVTDAYCGNRQNGGSDFRLAYFNGVDFYIDIVTITNP